MTSRKRSLLGGGSRSLANAVATSQANAKSDEARADLLANSTPALPIDYDFSDIPLNFTETLHKRGGFVNCSISLAGLVGKHPHHSLLVRQLVFGMRSYAGRGSAVTSFRAAHGAIELFIEFLNGPGKPQYREVRHVGHISTHLLRDYVVHLSNNRPPGTNKLSYPGIVRACNSLWTKFPGNKLVGKAAPVPKAPTYTSSDPINGYSSKQIKAIVAACKKDIIAVKRLHHLFDNLHGITDRCTMDSRKAPNNTSYCDERFVYLLSVLKHDYPEYPYRVPAQRVPDYLGDTKTDDRKLRLLRRIVGNCMRTTSFFDGQIGSAAIYAAMHFTIDTLYPFLLLFLTQTGWNLESAVALPGDVDSITMENPLKPGHEVVIFSRKERGAVNGKVVRRRCKTSAPFGPYQLLKYVEKINDRLRDTGQFDDGSLFRFTYGKINPDDWGLVTTLQARANSTLLMATARRFVKRLGLEPLLGKSISHMGLRSGYATLCEEAGLGVGEIADVMEHNDPATTDVHYLSDASSNSFKDKLIAATQAEYVAAMVDYDLTLVQSTTLQRLKEAVDSARGEVERVKALRDAARSSGLDEEAVVRVLSVEAQTHILVCRDALNPTWGGCASKIAPGTPCRFYNKCCFCRQAIVFQEALPYIARRLVKLDELKKLLPPAEWILKYNDEYDAWDAILAAWRDREQVASARASAASGDVALPHVLRGFW